MGKPTGFLEFERVPPPHRPVAERTRDFREVNVLLPEDELVRQAGRCMECGIPFCHAVGCPLQNLIPDFNDMVWRGQWERALRLLHSTNNFPEFTGRVCPAPCEASCTLSLEESPVTIEHIELQIAEKGWENGWIRPEPPGDSRRTGRRVAVVGSGPSGLAAAQQLVRAGHDVVLFEAADRPGGILRYGIPDFKLEKWVIDRRLEQMRAEGLNIETDAVVGEDLSLRYLRRRFGAVLLACGARIPRDLPVPGRDLDGIHFAMDFLTQQNRRNAGDPVPEEETISAAGKRVLIIGGGDTGSDCLGTALRQGASRVVQVEIMPRPPDERDPSTPWPLWPYRLRTSTSHEEGGERMWSVMTKEFLGRDGRVCGVRAVRVEWSRDPETGRMVFHELPESGFTIDADLVLLAMGFTREGNAEQWRRFGIEIDASGAPVLDELGMTSLRGVFLAGDFLHGASLVVRAIADGRRAAANIDRYLRGSGTA